MFLENDEITSYNLASILKNASMEVTDIEDPGFLVKSKDLKIDILMSKGMIVLTYYHPFCKYDQDAFVNCLLTANSLNTEIPFVRISIKNVDKSAVCLNFDYCYRIGQGLNVPQFISDLDFFEKAVVSIYAEHFHPLKA